MGQIPIIYFMLVRDSGFSEFPYFYHLLNYRYIFTLYTFYRQGSVCVRAYVDNVYYMVADWRSIFSLQYGNSVASMLPKWAREGADFKCEAVLFDFESVLYQMSNMSDGKFLIWIYYILTDD